MGGMGDDPNWWRRGDRTFRDSRRITHLQCSCDWIAVKGVSFPHRWELQCPLSSAHAVDHGDGLMAKLARHPPDIFPCGQAKAGKLWRVCHGFLSRTPVRRITGCQAVLRILPSASRGAFARVEKNLFGMKENIRFWVLQRRGAAPAMWWLPPRSSSVPPFQIPMRKWQDDLDEKPTRPDDQ